MKTPLQEEQFNGGGGFSNQSIGGVMQMKLQGGGMMNPASANAQVAENFGNKIADMQKLVKPSAQGFGPLGNMQGSAISVGSNNLMQSSNNFGQGASSDNLQLGNGGFNP